MHPLQKALADGTGLPSVCSAHERVITAAMEWAARARVPLLVEATANQVNQFGGYTGYTPESFYQYVQKLARQTGFPSPSLILGGDHLGPLCWRAEPAGAAMDKAVDLVKAYVRAGFTKIHIDASMTLGGDHVSCGHSPALVAQRGARLALACEEALAEIPGAQAPVYVVGSEVPVPGGALEQEEAAVTSPESFLQTVTLFREAFEKLGLYDAWRRVIAVVVQPGVEFSNDSVLDYDAEKASALLVSLNETPGLVFEGHSTDYQRPESLRAMSGGGVKILKVGPALTFALREGLFALSFIEEALLADTPERLSRFRETLDNAMLQNPVYWKPYYHGSESYVAMCRRYGLSDRCRYYLGVPEVRAAEEKLLGNLRDIPLGLLSQYMPEQARKWRAGKISRDPASLLSDKIQAVLEDYHF